MPSLSHVLRWEMRVFSLALHFSKEQKEQYKSFPGKKQMKVEDREESVLLSFDDMLIWGKGAEQNIHRSHIKEKLRFYSGNKALKIY